MRLAERISGSALPSLQDIYLKRCKSRAAKIIKDSNHPGNRLFTLLPSGKRFRSMMAKNWETEEELLPSGHQAPKLSLITSTGLNLINCKKHPLFSIIRIAAMCTYNLFAHSSCTSLFILIFIKSTVDCIAHFSPLHILLLILFYFILIFLSYSYLYLYILSCVMFHLLLYFFALSIERTRPDLHFTTDYTLYDCVCDK